MTKKVEIEFVENFGEEKKGEKVFCSQDDEKAMIKEGIAKYIKEPNEKKMKKTTKKKKVKKKKGEETNTKNRSKNKELIHKKSNITNDTNEKNDTNDTNDKNDSNNK